MLWAARRLPLPAPKQQMQILDYRSTARHDRYGKVWKFPISKVGCDEHPRLDHGMVSYMVPEQLA